MRKLPPVACVSCGAVKKHHSKGRCANCHERWRRESGLIKPPSKYVLCLRCEQRKLHHSKGYCRSCVSAVKYQSDPAYAAKQRARSSRNFRHKFGISLEDFNRMLQEQGNKCAICPTEHDATPWRALQVDHCHTTGKVRALLCRTCNTGLGHYERQAEGFRQYLARYGRAILP